MTDRADEPADTAPPATDAGGATPDPARTAEPTAEEPTGPVTATPRPRRTALLVAAAVALVVVVVAAVVVVTRLGGDDATGTAAPATATTSAATSTDPAPSSTPARVGGGGPLEVPGPQPPDAASSLADGAPTTLGAFGIDVFRAPDGSETVLPLAAGQSIESVIPARGGQIVKLIEPAEVVFVADDSSVVPLVSGEHGVYVDPAGELVAMETNADVTVLRVATGEEVARSALPESSAVVGFMADRVAWITVDALFAFDLTTGEVEQSTAKISGIRGAFRSERTKFMLNYDAEQRLSCLLGIDPRDLTEVGTACSGTLVPRRLTVAEDGSTFVAHTEDALIAVDTAAAFDSGALDWVRIGVPADHSTVGTWWEDDDTLIVAAVTPGPRTDAGIDLVLRCRTDGSPCERVPMPEVAGAPAVWFYET